MDSLIRGVEQFQAGITPQKASLYMRLALEQQPHTLFITCSDSRIQPDVITGAKPGEMFILRNVGNIIPPHDCGQPEAEAVVEYATVALSVRDIVICGHTYCGAIRGLMDPRQVEELPALASWLNHAEETRKRVHQKYAQLQGTGLINAAIRENVIVQMERIATLPCVASRLANNSDLRIHGWVYRIETGEIDCYDPSRDAFVPLTAAVIAEIKSRT